MVGFVGKPPHETGSPPPPPPPTPPLTSNTPPPSLSRPIAMVGCLDKPPMITTGKLPQEKLPLEKLPLVPTLQLDPPQPSLKPLPQLAPPNSASSHPVKKISLKNRKIIDYFNNMNQKLATSTPSPKHPPSLPPSLTTPCHKYPYTPSNTEAAWSGSKEKTSENVRVPVITAITSSADARDIAAASSVHTNAGIQYTEDDKKRRKIQKNLLKNQKLINRQRKKKNLTVVLKAVRLTHLH